mgnify:CR=1 FL=1
MLQRLVDLFLAHGACGVETRLYDLARRPPQMPSSFSGANPGKSLTKARFLPALRHVMDSTRKRVIIEMADLTHGVEQPCLMDIKMATRTFTEEDAASQASKSVSK